MEIRKIAVCGSLSSNDVLITVRPDEELIIELESPVKQEFGGQILRTVEDKLQEFRIRSGHIRLEDRGALDCTIRARLETALRRSHA